MDRMSQVALPVNAAMISCSVALGYVNPAMLSRFVRRHGGTLQEAEVLFEELKRLLVTAAISREPLVPTKAQDEMWHHFILHTKDYVGWCEANFGRYLHHTPTDGQSGGDCQSENCEGTDCQSGDCQGADCQAACKTE